MRVEIRVDDERADEHARSLYGWLREEDELRGRVRLEAGEIAPGQMGGVSDVVAVALGGGGVGTALVGALAAWITSRRAEVKLTLKRPDGTELSVRTHSLEDTQALLGTLREFLDDPA